MDFILPDYKNSTVNFISSILEKYNVPSIHSTLPEISSEYLNEKKNIVLIILDGFGFNLLSHYAENETKFLNKHLLTKIKTVFPSTTTAAITSFYTNKTPFEHGLLGWTLYFKEYFRMIEYLPCSDHIRQKNLDEKIYDVYDLMSPQNIFGKITQNSDIELNYLTPFYLIKTPYTKMITNPSKMQAYKKQETMYRKIGSIINRNSKRSKFVVAYSTSPDHLEHKYGVYSEEVRKFIQKTDRSIEKLARRIANTNTAIFITADHGLRDMKKYHFLNEIPKIDECMILPPFPEPRFVSFFIKNDKIKQFEEEIHRFDKEFLIFTKKEFIDRKLLGIGARHPKIDDFIGDFVAIGIADSGFSYKYRNIKPPKKLLAHHCGLTADEMEVPLIKIDC